jgi:putative endonuclease
VSRPQTELRRGRGLNNRLSGAWGEDLALRYLARKGYALIERNYRTRYGELDLILRRGSTIVFVEVKMRRGVGFGDPREAITRRKQTTIRTLARQYVSEREPEFDTLRFDVVGIIVGAGKARVAHVENAF